MLDANFDAAPGVTQCIVLLNRMLLLLLAVSYPSLHRPACMPLPPCHAFQPSQQHRTQPSSTTQLTLALAVPAACFVGAIGVLMDGPGEIGISLPGGLPTWNPRCPLSLPGCCSPAKTSITSSTGPFRPMLGFATNFYEGRLEPSFALVGAQRACRGEGRNGRNRGAAAR